MRPSRAPRKLLLLLISFVVASPVALGAYLPNIDEDGRELEPNPTIRGNVTIARHKPVCDTDVLCFEDDVGKKRSLSEWGFLLSDRITEPIRFQPQRVDVQYYGEDSASKTTTSAWGGNISDKSWLDIANWAKTSDEANDTIEVLFHSTGAHVLHLKSPGTNPGTIEADTYTLDFRDLTADNGKYRATIGVEVVSNSNSVLFTYYDTNGTGSEAFSYSGDTAEKATGPTILGNSTGTTFWDPLISDGDTGMGGITRGIGKMSITLYSNSAVGPTDVYIYALGIDPKRWEFGKGENGESIYNMTYTDCAGAARSSPLGYACLATFAPNFAYQQIRDLQIAYMLSATSLPDNPVGSDVRVAESPIDAAPYVWEHNYRFTYHLPKILDLAYAGDEAVHYTLPVPGKQHVLVRANAVDKLAEVEKKARATELTLLSAPPTGKDFEVEMTVRFTEEQLEVVTSEGYLWFAPGSGTAAFFLFLASLPFVGLAFVAGRRRSRRQRVR